MSISPISSYMMSMYVPTSTSALNANKMDYEYMQIIQELASYGISSSGDKNVDKMKLETLKLQIEMMQTQNSSNTKQSIPFEDVMNTLNLTVTGDLEKDYDSLRLEYNDLVDKFNDLQEEIYNITSFILHTS